MYSGLTTMPRTVKLNGQQYPFTIRGIVVQRKPFRLREALFDETAARVVGFQQLAFAKQRLVDGHFAVVDRDGNGNVARKRRIQIC